MSHYTVGVIIESNENVEQQVEERLLPFCENLDVDPYPIMSIEELKEEYDKVVNYEGDDEWDLKMKEEYKNESLEFFCENYHGKTYDEELGLLSTYNPDSKWDWYVIGGRWSGCLPIKGKEASNEDNDAYEDNVDDNICKIKDLEIVKTLSEQETKVKKEKYEELTTKGDFFKPEYYLRKYPTFEDYVKDETTFSTYALLTSKNEWIEPGQMGWFGCSSATPEEEGKFADIFAEYVKKENPEHYFVLVDCHI